MSKIIDKIPSMNIEEINQLRKNAKLKLDSPQHYKNASEVLDAIDKELERRYLPNMIVTFKEHYPDGFYGSKQAEEERDYKVSACSKCKELLNKNEFEDFLNQRNHDELFNRVKQIVNITNFIQGSFEKPKFLDTIKNEQNGFIFFEALYQCLWSDSLSRKAQLDNYFAVLENLNLSKWTYATYFLFLFDPDNNMFIKPEMLKKSLEVSQYPLAYESKPSSEIYLQVLEFSKWLKNKISELEPRDMIDVHSFMWHMAPTGKWTDE